MTKRQSGHARHKKPQSAKGDDPLGWTAYRRYMLRELADIFGDYGAVPNAFCAPYPKALKIGIFDDLVAEFPGINGELLKAWLGKWCQSTPYLKRIAYGSNRHDLHGQDIEPISEAHKSYALGRLKKREKIKAGYRPQKLAA